MNSYLILKSPNVSNSSVGQATKKVRRRSDLPVDTKDLTVDGNERKIQETYTPRLSYKSTLIGHSKTSDLDEQLEDFGARG